MADTNLPATTNSTCFMSRSCTAISPTHPTVGAAAPAWRGDFRFGNIGLFLKEKAFLTDSAFKADASTHVDGRLERGLEPLALETGLAEVLRITRRFRDAFSSRCVGSFALVRAKAVSDLNKAVFMAVIKGLFHFSNLLQGLEVFLLFSKQLALKRKEIVLSLKNLIIQLTDNCRHFVEVANGHGRFTKIASEAEGCRSSTNKRKVHGNLPDSRFVGCGDHDFTSGFESHSQRKRASRFLALALLSSLLLPACYSDRSMRAPPRVRYAPPRNDQSATWPGCQVPHAGGESSEG